jgi:DNA polymerase-4
MPTSGAPSRKMRKIIHVDADSFYASVEMRDNPSLADKPIAVGGSSDRRGVVATANYAARKFGVHSAMSSARALQQCPELIILPPRFELYKSISREFHKIFHEYTGLVEPLSLDEAYLDVSDCEQCGGSATLIANEIRQRVRDTLNLTVSAGVAPNKFLAKVASDWNKPDGTYTISPEQVAGFVVELPVSKINGVGKVTEEKMRRMGIVTCGDLQGIAIEVLAKRFGKWGSRLAQLAHGIDNREVKTDRVRKSISVERTYPQDLSSQEDILEALEPILEELAQRFSRIEQNYSPVARFIKVKFKDFTQTTVDEAIIDRSQSWLSTADYRRMLLTGWQRQQLPVRLLGVGLRLEPGEQEELDQLSLFENQ